MGNTGSLLLSYVSTTHGAIAVRAIACSVLLAACGGGGGGDDGGGDDEPPHGGIFVRSPTDDGSGIVHTFESSIGFAGDGFISPGNTDCVNVFPANLTLTWRNETTGQSGSGISGSYCAETFLGTFPNSSWSIRQGVIELAIGTNRIVITVADNSGHSSSVTIPIERLEDLVPPIITRRFPAPDETDVPANRTVSVRFSEAMLRSSLTPARFTLTDSFGSEINGVLTYDGSNFAWRLDPNTDLIYLSVYTVTIGGGVEDLFGGNTLGADDTWSFTTAANPDVTPPAITRVSPEPATECVAPDTSIVANFDEPLDSTTVNASTFLLADEDGGAVTGGVAYDGIQATLAPDLPLLPGTGYDATLTTGIRDLAGNGLAADFGWSFRLAPVGSIGGWTQSSTTNAPSGRYLHTAVWTGTEMIVFGGRAFEAGAFTDTNTGGRYDPLANAWTVTSTANVSSFSNHTAVWTGTEMIVWGGNTSSGARYDPATDAWQSTSTADAPSARSRHAAVWTGAEMLIWGGEEPGTTSIGTPVNTGARYDPVTDMWTPMTTDGAPSARVGMAAVWTGSELVVWGGISARAGGIGLTDGARYDPATDAWAPLPESDTRSGTHVVGAWTGSEALIWNGGFGTVVGSDGFIVREATLRLYDPAADAWRATADLCEPYLGASGYHAQWTGSRLFVWAVDPDWGGYFYDPASDTWQAIATTGGPDVRTEAASVWAGDRFILWGGSATFGGLQDTGLVFME
jgi:N-acetylneuraminic acid mutarotase